MSPAYDPLNHLLILDFDGVIIDSIEECLVVGYNAAMTYLQRPERISSLQDLTPEQAERLRRLRNFIRTGEDYVYLALADIYQQDISNQDQFDRFCAAHQDLQPLLRRLFYQTRQDFLANTPELWLQLNPFYAGMQSFLSRHKDHPSTLILTTKKLLYVQVILDQAQIYWPPERLCTVDKGIDKIDVLKQLIDERRLASWQVHFVDDQVDTLLKAKVTGVGLYLARWGYVNAEQLAQAQEAAIPVLILEDFYRLFSL